MIFYCFNVSIHQIIAFLFITARPKTPELRSGDEARKTLCEKIPHSSAVWVFYIAPGLGKE
jgi:hypothetical protein